MFRINEEQAGNQTQQIMEAQVGQLILTCARLRAETQQYQAEIARLMTENDGLKASLAAKEPVPVS